MAKRLSVHRSYFQPDDIAGLVAQAREDLSYHRLPHVSIKPPSTWAQVASGAYDAWLRQLADELNGLANPVFLTIHHEPENDAGPVGMTPQDFVAMFTKAVSIFSRRAPKVTVFPVLMGWTFDPRSGRNPNEWFVSSSPIFGLDLYNPWSPTNGKSWEEFTTKMDNIVPYAHGKPIAIGEHGCRTDPNTPGKAANWMRNAFAYAKSHNIVSMSYFNSGQNSPDGTWALDAERGPIFEARLSYAAVVRP